MRVRNDTDASNDSDKSFKEGTRCPGTEPLLETKPTADECDSGVIVTSGDSHNGSFNKQTHNGHTMEATDDDVGIVIQMAAANVNSGYESDTTTYTTTSRVTFDDEISTISANVNSGYESDKTTYTTTSRVTFDDEISTISGKLQQERSVVSLGDEEAGGPQRAAWGGKMEFLFTCIGYAVGLGNVWRFPYLCYKNGGGAFLIPYVIMLAFVGLPLFFMELAFGQFASLGPISIWKINPLMKGLGYAMVAVSWLISVYYNVIISHCMLYLFASFAAIPSGLPWVSCGNWWNDDRCLETGSVNATNATAGVTEVIEGTTAAVAAAGSVLKEVVNRTGTQTPAEQYYYNFVLEISDGIEHANGVNWKLALCLLLSWIIVLICLIRGISSLGKVVYFTAVFPYVMLTILLIRGATLPGAGQGILYYLKPDFSRLSDPRVWSDAATQIFYSLSACSGGLIAMSSYNKFDNNCYKDALIVALINCGTSIYGGFAIFSILGFMAQEKGVPVSEVAQGGPGLAFVAYPEALAKMPAPQLWAIFFFFMMATLGFGSQFSIVECVLSAFTDEFSSILGKKRNSILFRIAVIVFTFFMGLPMVTRGGIYLLDLVDYSVSGFPLLVIGVLECVCIAYCYGYDRFAGDIELMLGHTPNYFWKITWMGLTPFIIVVTIIFNCIYYKAPMYGDDYHYPAWAEAMGWMIGLFPIMLIVVFFLWRLCKDGGFTLTREIGKPKTEWGPLRPENRKGTIYQAGTAPIAGTAGLGTTDLTWRYDPETQTFIFPDTIQLSKTPSGSMYNLNAGNVANVQNYTGPIPVILNIPGVSPTAGPTNPQAAATAFYRQTLGVGPNTRLPNSRSMTDLALAGIKNTRASTRSVGDLNQHRVAGNKSPQFASMAHVAQKVGSSMSSLSHSMAQAVGAGRKAGTAPPSGDNTPHDRGSRAGSKASTHIYLDPAQGGGVTDTVV